MSTLTRPPLGFVQTSGNTAYRPGASSKPVVAQGGAMSAVRNQSKYAAPSASNNVTTTAITKPTPVSSPVKSDPISSTPSLARSAGAPGKNSPSEPAQPPSPANPNPRSSMLHNTSASRELFPSTFNATQPSVSRSSTFSRGADVSAIHAKFGFANPTAMHALPTANMSLDSATFGSLLHTRDSKFLIPPFRMPTHGGQSVSQTPDIMSAFGRSETPGAQPAMSTESPTRKNDGGFTSSLPVCYYTIVFDLDETLCCNRGPGKAILRPGAIELLKSLRAISTPQRPVEIILWTASVESLARQVLVRLDPDETIFTDCVFRDRRWFKETGYTKDLRLLGRDMEHVVIIENSPMSVTLNRQQSILVKDFMGHAPHDCDLKVVREVLEGWITADEFVSIREWLAQHPKIDRGNTVIAAPSLNAIMGARTGGVASTGVSLASGGVRKSSPVGAQRYSAAIPVFAGKRW